MCERLLLFFSPQNIIANSSGVFALDMSTRQVFSLKITVLFDQMQPYHLYIILKMFL